MTNGGQRPDPSGFRIDNEMDLLFGRAHPNPTREGCPPADMLMRLAHRELPINDPAYDHIGKCSPCYQELRAIQQADAGRQATAARRRRLAYAAAAMFVLAIVGSWFALRQTGETVEQVVQLDLRPYAITRGEAPQVDRPALVLPRASTQLTLLLPTGSEPGPYEVEIRDASAASKASARGQADLRNQTTTLEVDMNLASLSPGAYQLSVRRRGDEWQLFPCKIE
jgi:hypothetical protein